MSGKSSKQKPTAPRPGWRRWYVVWPVALLAAALVTPWFVMRIAATTPITVAAPGDRVQQAINALRTDHFYVGPELADRITPAQKAAIIAALKSAKTPSYLVYWDEASSNGGFYISFDALKQIMKGVGVNGLYSTVNEKLVSTDESQGVEPGYLDPTVLHQRPAVGLLAYAQQMAASPNTPEGPSFDYWGGAGGGIAAGALFAGLGYLGVLVAMGILGMTYRWFRS